MFEAFTLFFYGLNVGNIDFMKNYVLNNTVIYRLNLCLYWFGLAARKKTIPPYLKKLHGFCRL
jgi:hypothetical protein